MDVKEHSDATITLRLPTVVVRELRAVATCNNRSLSAEARLALRAWLEANPPKEEEQA